MPRIRTVKPEFWSSPGIQDISPWARLLFIAMWNWADDAGRGTCQLRELQAFAFPLDEEDTAPEVATMIGFRRTLAQVREQYGVVFYKVAGRPYYAIPSWKRHQRNERTAKSKHPAPEDGEKWDFLGLDQRSGGASDTLRPTVAEADFGPSEETPGPRATPEDEEAFDPAASGVIPLFGAPNTPSDQGSGGASDNLRHGAAEAPQTSGPGTGEQGNRGTGEVTTSPRSARMDSDLDTKFQKFYAAYPRKKEPRKARKAYESAIKRGATPDQLLAAAERYAAERQGQPAKYTKHPTTWLNADSYLDEPDEIQRASGDGYQPYKNPENHDVYDEGLL